ncbi:hypothetical+protein [Methylocapsa aurea]|uniref:hypothetical protein n=1 Tax=Methylocapsa aurea TaxID=663610 RepID=UPI003D18DC49
MSPREIDRLTPAEFAAVTRGYLRSRGVDPGAAAGEEAEYFAALIAFEKAGLA